MQKIKSVMLAGLVVGSLVLSGDRCINGQDAVTTPKATVTSDTGESVVDKDHAADEDAIRMNGAAFV